jgi:hypothetical protein
MKDLGDFRYFIGQTILKIHFKHSGIFILLNIMTFVLFAYMNIHCKLYLYVLRERKKNPWQRTEIQLVLGQR